jgi:F-type H+-transporting ATPase subunit a
MIHIGLQSEYVLSVFGLQITNTFLTSVLGTVFLLVLALVYFHFYENRTNIVIRLIRTVIYELLKYIDMVTGDRMLSKRIFPLIATFFIFIVSTNLLGLLPGFLGSFFVQLPIGSVPLLKSPNSDLTTTLALALFSVVSIQYFSVHLLGFKKYVKRFLNFDGPINFILGFFEMISESVKVVSFSFRLFGNIIAGEILLVVIAFLLPYILPVPFMILELFVGLIQAFIFATLTLVFIQTSTLRSEGS